MPTTTHETVHSRTAGELLNQADWPGLYTHGRRWVAAETDACAAWQALSRAAFELGLYLEALDAWRRVVALSGRTAANLLTLGRIALHAIELELAEEALQEAETAGGEVPELLAARGMLLTYLGKFTEAEACCRRCLAINPEYVPAYTTLSRLIRARFSERELDNLARLARHERVPVDFRIPATFAQGQGLEARADMVQAFGAFQYAHTLGLERNRREGRRYDTGQVELRMISLMERFAGEDEPDPGAGDDGPVPIFIVGMPRSGTTLIESVLAAHSLVRAGGERVQMQQILSEWLDGPGKPMAEWRRQYLADIRAGTLCFTDKHPLNFEAAGLIARLFPQARIIHVRRNPVETCLSIYRNEFSRFWVFTDRLEDLGHYYGQYARLVAHWERVLGARFHTLQYEAFASDFNTQAGLLVAACGLDWEESCRNFQETNRAIATFSAVSAREPVVVRRGVADRYRPFIGPLVEALAAAGVDVDTGALRVAS